MIAQFVDNLVGIFSPVAAVRRAAARESLRMLGTYAAAERGRRTRDWKAPDGSADLAIIPDARIMIPRARQLVRDSAFARSAIHCVKRNVVGRGIVPVPVARDVAGDEFKAFNARAEKLFWEWASDPKLCDLEKRQTFWRKQRMCVAERVTAGEHFLVWSYQPGMSGVGLRYQSMESDQLYDIIQSADNGNQVRGGIEIDETAAPVAYHFWTRNPNDYLFRTNYFPVRVPLDRCMHYFDQERTRQVRGETMFAPVMIDSREHASIRSALAWRFRMEACIGAAIKSNTPAPGLGMGGPPSMPRAPSDSGTTPSGLNKFDFVPGMMAVLQPGEDIVWNTPTAAGGNFSALDEAILRGIAAGLDISYEQLVRDFTRGSYSSQRQCLLEDRRAWRAEQDLLIDTMIAPFYRLFIQCCFLEGKFADIVDIRQYFQDPARFVEAEYVPDGHEWIDPLKEATGFEKLLALRVITRKEIISGRGGRMRNTFQQIHDEKEISKELDIPFPEDLAAQMPMLKGAVVVPGQEGSGVGGRGSEESQSQTQQPEDEIEWDAEFGDGAEPDFENETVGEHGLLPALAEPVAITGRGFGAPSDSFGPHDVFDTPEHAAADGPVW